MYELTIELKVNRVPIRSIPGRFQLNGPRLRYHVIKQGEKVDKAYDIFDFEQ